TSVTIGRDGWWVPGVGRHIARHKRSFYIGRWKRCPTFNGCCCSLRRDIRTRQRTTSAEVNIGNGGCWLLARYSYGLIAGTGRHVSLGHQASNFTSWRSSAVFLKIHVCHSIGAARTKLREWFMSPRWINRHFERQSIIVVRLRLVI